MEDITNFSTMPQPSYTSFDDGNWFQRVFDGSKLDIKNQQIATENDRLYNDYQTRLAMAYNSAEAQKNRDFQKMMSDTQYSRTIADLKRNGINPYLSLGGGSLVSSPSGSSSAYAPNSFSSKYSSVAGKSNGFLHLVGSALLLASKFV